MTRYPRMEVVQSQREPTDRWLAVLCLNSRDRYRMSWPGTKKQARARGRLVAKALSVACVQVVQRTGEKPEETVLC